MPVAYNFTCGWYGKKCTVLDNGPWFIPLVTGINIDPFIERLDRACIPTRSTIGARS